MENVNKPNNAIEEKIGNLKSKLTELDEKREKLITRIDKLESQMNAEKAQKILDDKRQELENLLGKENLDLLFGSKK
ncbi:hypothetical protein [Salmonella enterica]|uniref:hypothetical protein n=1 Tax=Salmonella enterica TaxID=28901 RepID=UPI000DEC66C7|nr:hypothetical protein [Salmonella enterica]AXD45950.1 hypothetical protein CHD70_27860 [Salmonella enterica]EDZ4360334.1 hypothetical protein [Salmonella enterica]EFS7375447.1 hypothetical protein [Salmonella enterica]HBA1512885.1 hypothetical protein [Citrobacter koseri]